MRKHKESVYKKLGKQKSLSGMDKVATQKPGEEDPAPKPKKKQPALKRLGKDIKKVWNSFLEKLKSTKSKPTSKGLI